MRGNVIFWTCLEQLEAKTSFRTITDTKIMRKFGFNCQLLLSEIGLTTDLSQSTCFHIVIGRRRTRLDIKKIEEAEPSQDDTDQPLFLAPKILPFLISNDFY